MGFWEALHTTKTLTVQVLPERITKRLQDGEAISDIKPEKYESVSVGGGGGGKIGKLIIPRIIFTLLDYLHGHL
mgnify:CR=1 FL=1